MVFVETIRRPMALVVAGLFLLASALPLLISRSASAYTLLGEREIRLSTSEIDAIGTSYRVNFEVSSTDDIGGIVVTFCEGTPIIGDTACVVPAGFVIASNAYADGDQGEIDVSGWTAAISDESSGGSGNNTFTLTSGTAATGFAAGDDVTFTLTNVTNPSATGTYLCQDHDLRHGCRCTRLYTS
jgi:hypothetical protein